MGRIHEKIPPGTRFGRLVVMDVPPSVRGKGNIMYTCMCDCGKVHEAYSYKLKNGATRSCGCFRVSEMVRRWAEWEKSKCKMFKCKN